MKFIDEMTELALPIIEESGCELVDAEYVKEGQRMILRFYTDLLPDGGISIDELAMISEKISEAIDRREDIRDNFVLEVSSPEWKGSLKSPRITNVFPEARWTYPFTGRRTE